MASTKPADERKKQLGTLIKSINEGNAKKAKGGGVPLVIKGSDLKKPVYIKTGIRALDAALGGGLPRGCISTFWGAPNCGKTSALLSAVREVQRFGGIAVWVDVEDLSPEVAKRFGINLEDLIIITPTEHGEQALNGLRVLLWDKETKKPRGLVDFIAVDSFTNLVAAATVKAIEEGGLEGSSQMARRAAMIARFVEELQGRHMLGSGEKGTALGGVAQERADPNTTYGDPTKMSGGKALAHASKIIVRFKRGKPVNKSVKVGNDKKEITIGHEVNTIVEKNAVEQLPTKASYTVLYGIGVDDSQEIAADAIKSGIIVRRDKESYRIFLAPPVEGQEVPERIVTGGIDDVRKLVREDRALKDTLQSVLESMGVTASLEEEAEETTETTGSDREENESA